MTEDRVVATKPSHKLPPHNTQHYSSMHGYMVGIHRVNVKKKKRLKMQKTHQSITLLTLRKAVTLSALHTSQPCGGGGVGGRGGGVRTEMT